MTVLFARGTAEPGLLFLSISRASLLSRSTRHKVHIEEATLTYDAGNVGILTGPPFFAAIAAYMNGTDKLAIQGVDYPADIAGFLAGGSLLGGVDM